MKLDLDTIITTVITATVGGGISWLFHQVRKTAKDMNAVFRKLRVIQTTLFDNDLKPKERQDEQYKSIHDERSL